ncbi:Glycosyltransferase involved in cell wall bisynthesis [Peptoclostridium litorale DSM 5388]|uniref:Glycosyltransferase n=1 Tax=Peptoclostridium litorale DSM 5388 TaxID=1121324 RepID=A0A069RC57_PEPLI|nr:glycosyltransferase family 4 protein [Peptoclostridium litorale]KDR94619.1 glycosyltransferase [Peptoclostridium litorale DSM 5388]SIO30732.1 Glycosyltransferase involved in cell wall bisynthesis [Peptoclostridium litorale DSM 5388]
MGYMNILFVTDQLIVGGAEAYFYRLENCIDRESFNMYTAAGGGCYTHRLREGERFTLLPQNPLARTNVLRRIIRDQKIDIVHANSLRMALLSDLIRRAYGLDFKIVYTKHNVTYLEKLSENQYVRFLNGRVDKTIAVCEADRRELLGRGVLDERIETVFNGVDTEKFRFDSKNMRRGKGFSIGILGRLTREKNHGFFIDIMEELFKRRPTDDISVSIAGDGQLREDIESRIKKKKLQGSIEMLGMIDSPPEFLREMDMIMLVSTREKFPMTILEGMAVGSVVLSIDRGGIGDCVTDGETGYLIEEHDIGKFCNAIENIMDGDNSSVIHRARRTVEERFDIASMVEGTQAIYEGCAGKGANRNG